MKKQLVLAEKPSVGRELASVIGSFHRAQGYFEGERYIVTWALGHLIELDQPHHYDPRYKRWRLEDLPILPKTLTQSVMENTKSQYQVIEKLLKREDVESLIIATDAGREGELVARWIMKKAGWDKEVYRLWISSQTEEAIVKGFSTLKEGSLFESLYHAAEARAAADWYVGLNVSRCLTRRYDARLSAGRVQTPTLALIVKREEEREAFLGEFYYSIRLDFAPFSASYIIDGNPARIKEESKAQQIVQQIEKAPFLITSIEKSEKSEEPPLLYDLTELQKDANHHYGLSAKETLDTLQRLYEVHKIVTYPRTDSRYITSDIVPTLTERLKALEETSFGQVANLFLTYGFREDFSRFVSETKVTDHHALLPTEKRVDLSNLSAKEKMVWELITLRFMEVLSKEYRYNSTVITLQFENHTLSGRTQQIVQRGYKDMATLIGLRAEEETILEPVLTQELSLSLNDTLTPLKVRVRKSAETPPPRYTEGTLLMAMEHAGRTVEDASLKRHLTGGLGTPATRADIIEKLLQNYYIERDGKALVPTAKGRELIRLAPSVLQSAELTARWERRLTNISENSESKEQFIEDIKETTRELVSEIKGSKERFSPTFSDGKKCPYCSAMMMKYRSEIGQIHYQCQRLSCSYEEALVTKQSVSVKAAPSGDKKRVVVVKKRKEEPLFTIKVITPSRYRAPLPKERDKTEEGDVTTFAALLAASEKRNKERNRRK